MGEKFLFFFFNFNQSNPSSLTRLFFLILNLLSLCAGKRTLPTSDNRLYKGGNTKGKNTIPPQIISYWQPRFYVVCVHFPLPALSCPCWEVLSARPLSKCPESFIELRIHISIFWPLITTHREKHCSFTRNSSPVPHDQGRRIFKCQRETENATFPQIKEWGQKALRRHLKRKSEANSTLKIDINKI